MTQRIWTIIEAQTGATIATITADTEMRGINVESAATWFSYHSIEQVVSHLNTANAWLLDNGGVVQ